MFAIDLPHARRLALAVVLFQAAVTALVCAAALGLGGGRAALAAAIGGGIAILGSLAMATFAFLGEGDAQAVLGRFYLGEAVKLAVVVVAFAVVLGRPGVPPGPLLAGFAATFVVYWLALLRGSRAATTRGMGTGVVDGNG